MTTTLEALEAELTRLQGRQSTLADPAQEQRRREAAHLRQSLEQHNRRTLEAIEPVRRQAEQLQQRVDAMKKSGVTDVVRNEDGSLPERTPAQWRLHGFKHELAKTLAHLAAMVERAKIEIAASQPKIAECRHVEAGATVEREDDVELGLGELAGATVEREEDVEAGLADLAQEGVR